MNQNTEVSLSEQLAVLRKMQVPFAKHEISLLPKQMKKDDTDKGKCGGNYSADGRHCGGYHARSIHLDYVGHAALTKRLLEVDPLWTWEPLAAGADGLPQFDKIGGLWIRLHVGGVSRLGYGDSQGKTGPNAIKEAIGDALRNAAMRFGAALDLWHKGDLYDASELKGLVGDPLSSGPAPAPVTTGGIETMADAMSRLHDSIDAIKQAIGEDRISAAAEAWAEISNEDKQLIWVAPSKGGPFTTQERAAMKSPAFSDAMKSFKEPA